MKNFFSFYMKALPFLSVIFICYFLLQFNFDKFHESVGVIDLLDIIIFTILIAMGYFVKAYRWYLLVNLYRQVNFVTSTHSYFKSIFYGSLSFGRVGEFSRAELLQSRGLDMRSSILIAVVDRIYDLALLGLVATVGGLYYFYQSGSLSIYLIILGVLFITLTLSLRFRNRIQENLRFIFNINIKIIILSLFNLAIYLESFWVLAQGMKLVVDRSYLYVTTASAILGSLLPLSWQGLGVRDTIVFLFFRKIDLSLEQSITFSLASFFMVFFITICLTGGHFFFTARKMNECAPTKRFLK